MTQYHGFELVQETEIPELSTKARLYTHVKSGARLLSLENDDENKVFSINFRTPPPDSTGLPHIMEHAVLCGSQRFPVREPFVELLKGSLKTFVNAFTFPDKTCYPVASQNVQDFYNLIDVYMDAVLYPLIPPHVLEQEGWHYELDSAEGELNYKGVVFNEMKGAYSSPDSLMAKFSQELLFPGHVYGLDSGGDPQVIPNLTYSQFKHFHETYYHPSNAYIFFYGDDDPAQRLERMDAYLRDFSRRQVDSAIGTVERFKAPARVTKPFDAGEQEQDKNQHMLTMNWLLDEVTDRQYGLALGILAHILIGTPASPLRKALIDSGLGEDLAGVGLERDLRQPYFSTGLKGINPENLDKVEALIVSTLTDLAQNGIDADTLAASLNTVEFRLRENNTGGFPRGIVLMIRALNTWLYDGDPVEPLAFENPLGSIRQRMADGERVFENLIRQHLLDNAHTLTLVLEPDAALNERLEAQERERLEAARGGMSAADLEKLVENTQALKRIQETPDSAEALATIPVLTLADLEPEVKTIPIEEEHIAGVATLYHDLFTNGIVYLDLGMDLKQLPETLLPYVPLFGRSLVEMGTAKEDFVKLSQRIGKHTGGIHATEFTTSVRQTGDAETWLFVRGKSTVPSFDELAAILGEILLSVRLDNRERFRQMVLEEKANLEAALVPSGHAIVNGRLRAHFNTADRVSEQMSGVSYLFFLRELAQRVEENWQDVLEKLEMVRTMLVRRPGMLANVTLDSENWGACKPAFERFLEQFPDQKAARLAWELPKPPANEGLTIPAQVNYVGKGGSLYDLGYRLDGSMMVIRNYLRTTWLWERVRVQGGAYGGFCVFDPRTGVFSYISYRDPNLLATLDIYDRTAQFLRDLDLSQEELVKTIIGAIGEMDAYLLPDAKGFASLSRYLAQETDEQRQQLREQILSTTQEDFRALAPYLERVKESGEVVVLGSAEAIRQADEERGGWLDVNKVL